MYPNILNLAGQDTDGDAHRYCYNSRLPEYSMHGVEQSSFLVVPTSKIEQQERKSETPGTVCKFRDLGWQYLCNGALVPTPPDGRGSDQGDR